MTFGQSTTELLVHKDARLLPAIQPVVVYASERTGLSGSDREDLARATADACREAFGLASKEGNPDPVIKLEVSSFQDRVEIAIEHTGDTCLSSERRYVDRVDCETHGGKSRTTLVKYGAASKTKRV